jgi:hypothetical protein
MPTPRCTAALRASGRACPMRPLPLTDETGAPALTAGHGAPAAGPHRAGPGGETGALVQLDDMHEEFGVAHDDAGHLEPFPHYGAYCLAPAGRPAGVAARRDGGRACAGGQGGVGRPRARPRPAVSPARGLSRRCVALRRANRARTGRRGYLATGAASVAARGRREAAACTHGTVGKPRDGLLLGAAGEYRLTSLGS